MKNIWVLSENINISAMAREIDLQSFLWHVDTQRQRNIYVQQHTEAITLVNGVRNGEGPQISFNDLQAYEKTPLWNMFPTVTNWLQTTFPTGLSRVLIVKLLPEKQVYKHVDSGSYYRARTRFHLVLKGRYVYNVGNESIIASPGMLFCFNNSLTHNSLNLENEDRVSVIFDVEHTSFGLGLTIIKDC